jgi:uncharacterized protein YjeT (DUF2065 family)
MVTSEEASRRRSEYLRQVRAGAGFIRQRREDTRFEAAREVSSSAGSTSPSASKACRISALFASVMPTRWATQVSGLVTPSNVALRSVGSVSCAIRCVIRATAEFTNGDLAASCCAA